MRFLSILIAIFVFLTPISVNAACYNAAEAEAEQGIRIHSELMVIGLNCQHMTPRGWKNFYQEYREITSRHQSLFNQYEQTLINFYSRNGSNAEKRIHTLRTDFANKTSTDAAKMRPDVFCANFAPRIPQVGKMSRSEFQQWAASTSRTEALSQSRCN